MKIIRLYYISGTVLVIVTLALFILSVINFEALFIFALTGLLLIALGLIQHLLSLHEEYH